MEPLQIQPFALSRMRASDWLMKINCPADVPNRQVPGSVTVPPVHLRKGFVFLFEKAPPLSAVTPLLRLARESTTEKECSFLFSSLASIQEKKRRDFCTAVLESLTFFFKSVPGAWSLESKPPFGGA